MKKYGCLIIALLTVSLLLTACMFTGVSPTTEPGKHPTTTSPIPTSTTPVPTTDPVPTTTDPIPTTTPTDPVPTTTPTEPVPTTTDPVPTTEPISPEQAAIMELFNDLGPERSPYYWATGCEYASPQEVKLIAFFDGGFEGEHEMTSAEYEELKGKVNWSGWLDVSKFNRLPKDRMEAELQAVFGISLSDLHESAFDELYYLECSDCYCFLQTGMTSAPMMGPFLDIIFNADGTVSVIYNNRVADYVMTLKPNGDGYLILSNVKAE